MYILAC